MNASLPVRNSRAKLSRRSMLGASAGVAAVALTPHVSISQEAREQQRVNLAGIGAGGMGGGDIATFARLGCNIVALCDVDDERAAGSYRAHPKARRYKDFRQLIDKEARNIDAVTIGTPDHIHAVAAMAAIRAGKHVYVQKPLTHTLHECRELTRAARGAKVVTSMGNQGHATEGARLTNEWIQAGAIGEVREVHVWSDRAGRLWRQGIGRPADRPAVPASLDWDLWLGPARERPYHNAYAPVAWRGWWDFGTGALGDMGCHIIDHPVWALNLGAPTTVEARVTIEGTMLDGNRLNAETYPVAAIITYQFPARGKLPPVTMTWYDGGLMPPTPTEMPAGQRLPTNGVLYVGSRAKMFHGSHGGMPQILNAELHKAAQTTPRSMERSPGHYEEFVRACRGGPRPTASFHYSGPMTETVLLGVLALRAPGTRLEWDSERLRVRNADEVNRYIHKEYRKGWTL